MREQRSLTDEGGGVGGQRLCVTCGVSKRLRVMCGERSGRSMWMRTDKREERKFERWCSVVGDVSSGGGEGWPMVWVVGRVRWFDERKMEMEWSILFILDFLF